MALGYVQSHSSPFGVYRIAVGVLLLLIVFDKQHPAALLEGYR